MALSTAASLVKSLISLFPAPFVLRGSNHAGTAFNDRYKVSKDESEIHGGILPTRNAVYLHLEQGLARSPDDPAILSLYQSPHYLDDLLDAGEHEQTPYDASPRHDKRTRFVKGFSKEGHFRSDCLQLSYRQIQSIALDLATGLFANDAQEGTTILMLIPNGAEFGLLLWMSVIMRITFVCADPTATVEGSDPEAMRHLLQTLKPTMIAVADAKTAKSIDALLCKLRLAQPLRIYAHMDECPRNWRSLADLVHDGASSSIDKEILLEKARDDDPQRIHSILFTSGTSGQPKGCPLRVGGMAHVLKSQAWLIDKGAAPFALQQAHPSRGIAPAQTLQTWRAGGAVVMTGSGFSVNDVADAIRQCGITFLVFTPAMVHELGQRLASVPFDVGSVRRIQIGGDAVTKGVMMRCAALFPQAEICVNHGMTEGGGSFIWPYFGRAMSQIPFFGEVCPVGAVAPGSTVRVWDPDEQKLCERGRPGELHICCGSIIKHYLFGRSEDSFYEDATGRYFKTGDIAMMNAEGVVFILGRAKDAIKRGGVTPMPAPLESCIEEFTSQAVSLTSAKCHLQTFYRRRPSKAFTR